MCQCPPLYEDNTVVTLNYEWLRLMILDAILHKTQETEKIKKQQLPFMAPFSPLA